MTREELIDLQQELVSASMKLEDLCVILELMRTREMQNGEAENMLHFVLPKIITSLEILLTESQSNGKSTHPDRQGDVS